MSPAIAQLENVSRLFGSFPALRQISAAFETGCCYVLLGENGAGKSTLLRMLAGLLRPSYGRVRVFGDEDFSKARERIGYMSHAPMLYEELSALENLRYFSGLYRACVCLKPEEALQYAGLDPELRRPLATYSQGMRQRASLARALLTQPELLLLDEPFSNLDAAGIQSMLVLLRQLRNERRTIVLTTHQRELATPLADYLVTLEAGRLVSFAPPAPSGVNQTGPTEEGSL
jgi:ABC-type multidrug transport system ATPase subunit